MLPTELKTALEPHLAKQRRSNLVLIVPGVIGLAFALLGLVSQGNPSAHEPNFLPPGTCEPGDAACVAAYKRDYAHNAAAQAQTSAAIFGAGALLLLLWGGTGWRRHRSLEHSAAGKALSEPDSIVWVYGLARSDGGAAAVNLCRADGSTVEVGVLPDELRRVEALLKTHLPRATHGHSPQNEAQFARDPASLRT